MRVRLRYDRNLAFWLVILGMIFVMTLPIYAYESEIQEKKQTLESIEQDRSALEEELDEAESEKMATRDRLMQTQEELEQAENELAAVQSDIDETEAKIEETEVELVETEKELEETEKELVETEEELEKTKEELEETEEELEEKEDFLAGRLKASYQNGKVSYIEVLFKADSFIDFLSRLNYINSIVEKDTELIEEVEEQREVIQAHKEEIEEQREVIQARKEEVEEQKEVIQVHKEELEEQEDDLKDLLAEAEAQRQEIAEKEARQRQLLSQLEAEIEEYERRLASKQEEAQQVEEMLDRLESQGDGVTGQMQWPVAGTGPNQITSPYGYRIHPVYNVERFHSGIDIGAPRGSNILAAESGIVVGAGVRGSLHSGYGRTVIIDHGEGYSTLYAHTSQNLVSEGEEVTRGQPIARVGATGTATGPHLHFEVRVNGKTINPMDYLN